MAIREGTFLVGGAVRDELLGRPVTDRDWVVVGRTVESMLAAGYTQVGKDFPVFLHPESHEEYALARTERKTSAGHLGFECHAGPEVTLEDDLLRRDLTVNALARHPDGSLIDPYGGEQDLRDGVLRHVSPAFVEDPLRVLRVARFAAQLGFSVAPETIELMQTMALQGALSELPAERVWHECQRALGAANPLAFFSVLAATESLSPWFVEVREFALRAAAGAAELHGESALQRFASLGLSLSAVDIESLALRLKAPRRFERLAGCVANCADALVGWASAAPGTLLQALHQAGALQLDAAERQADFVAMLAMLTDAHGDFDEGALVRLANNVAALGASDVHQAAAADGAEAPTGKALGAAIAQLRCVHISRAQNRPD